MSRILVTGVWLISAIGACRASAPSTAELRREHDDSLKVTCWVSPPGGVYCIPDAQLEDNLVTLEARDSMPPGLRRLPIEVARMFR